MVCLNAQTNEAGVEAAEEKSACYLLNRTKGVSAERPELGQQPLTFSSCVGVILLRLSARNNISVRGDGAQTAARGFSHNCKS